MKKKILISLVACFIAAGSFIHSNLSQNNHNMDISLADISVMARADGENPGGVIAQCQWSWLDLEPNTWSIIDCLTCSRVVVYEIYFDQDTCTSDWW